MGSRRVVPSWGWVVAGLVVGLGCEVAEEDRGAVRLRPGSGWCSQCGIVYSNAATVNGADLSDIHLDVANLAGVKLRPGSSADGSPFRLEIEPGTDRFLGVGLGDAADSVITGAQFVGAKIVLEMPGATVIDLEISDYAEGVPSWSSDGAPVTAYRAQYLGPKGIQPLCPATDPDNQWFTLIPGETYAGGVVAAAPRSVTIACVGEAAAKMKLMDFHPGGARGASPAERQATLRMITADYCGTGTSFTQTGTPVAWRDNLDTIKPPHGEDIMEALWDADGALCLSTPRFVAREDVAAVCAIPTCDDEAIVDGVVWRTMLPEG